MVVMGPSGTGKTTLLRLISGLLHPCTGTVEVNHQLIHTLDRDALSVARRDMGFLFQTGALFTNLTVFDNVAFPLREHTLLTESLIRTLVLIKLNAVGLRGARHLFPSELSGGMARRVALARAIALDPLLMLYDEPFVGLDPIGVAFVMKLIRELNDALGMTSIVVSHDVQESVHIADYIYLVGNQQVLGEGTPNEMLTHGNPSIKQFMKGSPQGPVPFHYPAVDYVEDVFA